MKDYFCKICMLRRQCNNNCFIDKKNFKLKSNNIFWINFSDFSEQIFSQNDYSIENEEFELIDDLFIIGLIKEYTIIYSPLISRLYLVMNKIIEEKNPKIRFKNHYYKELIESGLMLSKKQINIIKEKVYQKPKVSESLRIAFSSGCSLNCHYCYANSNNEILNIDIKKLNIFIDYLHKNIKLKKLELHGNGEPSFNFDEVKTVINLVKNKFPDINIIMQSNGQFNKDIAKWMVDNNVFVGFSIDGPEFIQNKQRPSKNENISSFDNIIDNIAFFKQYGRNPSVISTITSYNVSQMEIIYDFFKKIGCKDILLNPILLSGKSNPLKSNINLYNQSPDLNEFVANYSNVLIMSLKDGISMASRLLSNFSNIPKSYKCRVVEPHFIFLPNGYITSCCETLQDIDVEKNIFVFARCSDDKVVLKIENIEILKKRDIFDMGNNCHSCFIKWHCSGGCMADSYLRYNDIFKVIDEHCEARKKIANNYFNFLTEEMIDNYSL